MEKRSTELWTQRDLDFLADQVVRRGMVDAFRQALEFAEFEQGVFGREQGRDPIATQMVALSDGEEIEIDIWQDGEYWVAAARHLPGYVVSAASREAVVDEMKAPLASAVEAGLV